MTLEERRRLIARECNVIRHVLPSPKRLVLGRVVVPVVGIDVSPAAACVLASAVP
jgi:hypothetical protein